ncbi:MAG: hypothetical protein U9N59_15320 [Campylobacterota bacterium]|nr:hypothetical protein [Campylobacterota bacterium]
MNEPVTLTFIFQTIGVILAVTAIFVLLVNNKTKSIKKREL